MSEAQQQEIDRYRRHLKAIAEHHEYERQEARNPEAARYHEERRNVAMFPLVCPQARGERPLLEIPE